MDLVCFLHPGWAPLVRPASPTRAWMDETPEAFAYRCLPLDIANAHGWEILSPFGFDAVWDGGLGTDAVTITPDPGADAGRLPVSLFGQGVLTFQVEGVFRTPPGWDLWICGSPNRAKDGIAPLTGVVECDWSPYTFTMNWRFTRPHAPVRFEAMEPFCFFFPLQRGALEDVTPRFAPMDSDPALLQRFQDWSRSRDAFQARMQADPPKTPADRWQKHYYRGVDAAGRTLVADHRTKLRLRPFDASQTPEAPVASAKEPAAAPPTSARAPDPDEVARLRTALARREWLLESLERQRALAPNTILIERREGLGPDEFLERYYALNRPVILTGEMARWPALERWTPDYLRAKVGSRLVDDPGSRAADPRFEIDEDVNRGAVPFDAVMDLISGPAAQNDAYVAASESARNAEALSVLDEDLGVLDRFLDPAAPQPHGMMSIGPAGGFTPLHQDLTNRTRFVILPASEAGRLDNDAHGCSRIADLERPGIDARSHARLQGARLYEVVLEAGEALFIPFGWWRQARALSFGVTLTQTHFRWPNTVDAPYPA
jgi:hypothetical protein